MVGADGRNSGPSLGPSATPPGGLFKRMPAPHDSKEPSEAQNRPAVSENFEFRFVDTGREATSVQLPPSRTEDKVGVRALEVVWQRFPQFAQFAGSIYRVRQTKRRL